MATTLPITNKLAVTPLFDIQTAAFADTSAKGLWSALYGDYEVVKPLPDSYLVENLKRDASKGMLNRQQAGSLPYLGFYFGMVHSGILVPHTGQFRPDATAVVTFTHCDTKHGYSVGRRDHFYYAEPYPVTEGSLIEELCESAQDFMSYPDEPDSRYYSIGCLLGSISVSLFPATSQEWRTWEAEHREVLAKMHRDKEPYPSLPVVEYTARSSRSAG